MSLHSFWCLFYIKTSTYRNFSPQLRIRYGIWRLETNHKKKHGAKNSKKHYKNTGKKSTAVGRAGAGVGKERARPLAKPGRSPRLVVYISL